MVGRLECENIRLCGLYYLDPRHVPLQAVVVERLGGSHKASLPFPTDSRASFAARVEEQLT